MGQFATPGVILHCRALLPSIQDLISLDVPQAALEVSDGHQAGWLEVLGPASFNPKHQMGCLVWKGAYLQFQSLECHFLLAARSQ